MKVHIVFLYQKNSYMTLLDRNENVRCYSFMIKVTWEKEILLKMFFWKEVNSVCTLSLALGLRLAILDYISYYTTSQYYPGGLH